MARPVTRIPLPATNPFLGGAVAAPTTATAQAWRFAADTFWVRDQHGDLADGIKITEKRVQMYTFTQNGEYMKKKSKELYHFDNIISSEIDIREDQVDPQHWAKDHENRISKTKAIGKMEKYRDSLKKIIFQEFIGGVQRTTDAFGGIAALEQASKEERIDLFLRIFDQDPLRIAELSAAQIARVIDFNAIYHHDQMILESGDDIAGYIRQWIRWKFAQTCEIIFQKYIVVSNASSKREATDEWVGLWYRWARTSEGNVFIDETLLSPENWPVY